jgi:hypothetical protein
MGPVSGIARESDASWQGMSDQIAPINDGHVIGQRTIRPRVMAWTAQITAKVLIRMFDTACTVEC